MLLLSGVYVGVISCGRTTRLVLVQACLLFAGVDLSLLNPFRYKTPRTDLLPPLSPSGLRGMLTLFMAITNGVSWDDAIRPLREFSYVAVAFVCAYITIAVFAILNASWFAINSAEIASCSDDSFALLTGPKLYEQNSSCNMQGLHFCMADHF